MNFNFKTERNSLYQPLQKIVSIISGRPRLPILNHILLEIHENYLVMTATDLDIEIIVRVSLDNTYVNGSSTVPGRKFFEIFRSLPEYAKISIVSENHKLIISSGSSKFSVSTFPTSDFPKSEVWNEEIKLIISRTILKKMIELTQFSMGNQDVRYYLNGILFETKEHIVRIVATDGYRLSICEISIDSLLPSKSVIIPRKGIVEILRILNIEKELVSIQLNNNSIRIQNGDYILTSKLIDAIFPNYQDVFIEKTKNILEVECNILKHALKRVAILSNEKLRVVNFDLTINQLKITACNFVCETSEEILDVLYSGQNIKISFNVDYILDVLNVVGTQVLRFFLVNEVSSVQIEGISKCYGATYIVMPIRI